MLSRRAALLFGLFFTAFFLLNFPVLAIFSKARTWNGIPVVLIYLFSIWVVVIFLTWLFGDTPQYVDRFFKRWRNGKK